MAVVVVLASVVELAFVGAGAGVAAGVVVGAGVGRAAVVVDAGVDGADGREDELFDDPLLPIVMMSRGRPGI